MVGEGELVQELEEYGICVPGEATLDKRLKLIFTLSSMTLCSLQVVSDNKITCSCRHLAVRQTRFNRGNYRTGEFAILTAETSPDQEYLAQ